MTTFNPNDASSEDSGIFGLPFSVDNAQLILLPVPWEATTSYGGGTAYGPQAILKASKQVDLFDLELGNFYEAGIAMLDELQDMHQWNELAKKSTDEKIVNDYSEKINHHVYHEIKKLLAQKKRVGIVGGDHSSPFGAIKAFLEYHPDMSILHFDAHADLRKAFEGFEHSHASIMHNVISKTSLKKLVQIGIRDFCEDELNFMKENASRIVTFFDADMIDHKMNGKYFSEICDEIVSHLSNEVYVSFDIDGLDPRFCPHTGTPVPGGLDYSEALFLLKKVMLSGRKIIGFDLCEVSLGENFQALDTASEWDANVGARLLYKLCGYTLKTTTT